MAASGKLIAFADADGATSITELDKLESALDSHAIACGSRFTLVSKNANIVKVHKLCWHCYANEFLA